MSWKKLPVALSVMTKKWSPGEEPELFLSTAIYIFHPLLAIDAIQDSDRNSL